MPAGDRFVTWEWRTALDSLGSMKTAQPTRIFRVNWPQYSLRGTFPDDIAQAYEATRQPLPREFWSSCRDLSLIHI